MMLAGAGLAGGFCPGQTSLKPEAGSLTPVASTACQVSQLQAHSAPLGLAAGGDRGDASKT